MPVEKKKKEKNIYLLIYLSFFLILSQSLPTCVQALRCCCNTQKQYVHWYLSWLCHLWTVLKEFTKSTAGLLSGEGYFENQKSKRRLLGWCPVRLMGDGSSRLRVTSYLMALLSTGISGLSYISDNPPRPVVWAFPSGGAEAVGRFSWTSCKAPDLLFRCDVWAFGCTCHPEMYSEVWPWQTRTLGVVIPRDVVCCPAPLHHFIWILMYQCWVSPRRILLLAIDQGEHAHVFISG